MVSSKEQNQQPGTQHAMIRIYLLGPLCIEWEGYNTPFPKERLSGRGVAPALGLLKALLSQPDRFALRDWLLEQFWSESAISSAQERLDDVASGLRTLLRPPGNAAKILHYVYGSNGKGNGYRLEPYPLIWVDADAFAWYVEQAARFERFGQDALPLWEQAYHLGSRGSFLPEEVYSDWASERRELLAGQYRQCMHRLTTLLRERGATEQAILRLRSYWQTQQTDEDILRPLMELLGEQERYQEAEKYYQQSITALKDGGNDQQPDARTQDLREFLLTKQIQRTRMTPSPSLEVSTQMSEENLASILSTQNLAQIFPSSQTVVQGIMRILQELERINMDSVRRDFLHMLGTSLVFAGLSNGIHPFIHTLLNGDQMALLETEITTRWSVYHNGDTIKAHENLHLWLAEVEKCVQGNTSRLQNTYTAYSLLSRSYQLQGSIFRDKMDYIQAHNFYKRAFLVADEFDNAELKSSSLARRGVTFIQQHMPIDAIQYLEGALIPINDLGLSYLKGYIFQALSEAYAMTHHHEHSQRNIDLAEQELAQRSDVIESSNCQLNTTSITAQKGVNAVLLKNYGEALDLLNRGLHTYDSSLLRGWARLIAQKAEAYYGLEYIDKSVSTAKVALSIARSIGSQKTISRVKNLYILIDTSPYQKEKSVIQLGRLLATN